MTDKLCRHCGALEAAHHVFDPIMPSGCQCDPGEWDGVMNAVCGTFVGEAGKYCEECEHDESCHTARSEK